MRTFSLLLMALLLAACVGRPTPTSVPATTAAPPTAAARPTDTTAPPTPPPATATPAPADTPVVIPAPLFVVQSATDQFSVVSLEGQASALEAAPATAYALTYLASDLSVRPQVYALGPGGAQPLDFIQNVGLGFAAWTNPNSGEARLAWDTQSIHASGGLDSRIFVSDASGANVREILTELSSERVLRVVGWSHDGQHLYYSYEPLGLGGYILFSGFSNLWRYDWVSTVSARVVPDEAAGIICLDDFTAGAALVAHHCLENQMSLLNLSLGQVAAVLPPAEVVGQAHIMGRGRFSPAGDRLAFSLAAGAPENEQGWVAVSDTLTGPARLVATSAPGDYFDVIDWVDDQTLLLQSWAGTPGLWLVNADGTGLRRLADGRWLATLPASP